MKIWLDDIRPVRENGFYWAKTASEAISLLKNNNVEFIDYDHDLGNDIDGTGYDVAKWIEKQCCLGRMKCPKWNVHSANPVGEKNIKLAMEAAERYSNE